MGYFAGLDVSLEETSICIVDDEGCIVREARAVSEPVLMNLAQSLLSVIAVMTREVETLTKRVLDEVRVEPTCRRLMTVPGACGR